MLNNIRASCCVFLSLTEYVEFEIKRALEWLGGNEQKKLAAVLILRELAIHTPTLFYQQFQQFFDNIFTAVRDHRVKTSTLPSNMPT